MNDFFVLSKLFLMDISTQIGLTRELSTQWSLHAVTSVGHAMVKSGCMSSYCAMQYVFTHATSWQKLEKVLPNKMNTLTEAGLAHLAKELLFLLRVLNVVFRQLAVVSAQGLALVAAVKWRSEFGRRRFCSADKTG